LCTPGIERIFYGTHPVFCFNPGDDRNRPDPNVHAHVERYWRLFPKEFKEFFVKAFTVGLSDKNSRVGEKDWRDALIKLRASLVYVKQNNSLIEIFPKSLSSRHPQAPFLLLRFADGQVAALSHAARLYACHTARDITGFWNVTASIAAYDDNPLHLIARNETQDVWRYSLPEQPPEQAKPKETLPLVPGMSINFAGTEAVVE